MSLLKQNNINKESEMSKLNELAIAHNVKVGEIEKLQNKVDVINSCYDNFVMIG